MTATTFGVAEELVARASELERQAQYLRALAKKIASPPEGVTVEVDRARSIVRFVGPRTESASTSRSGPPTDTPHREAESANPADVRGKGQR